MFAGGSAPDVIMVDAYYAPDWFSRGMAVELGPMLDSDPEANAEDWNEVFLEDMTYEGKLYGLPTDCGPMIWQYNTELVGKSGKPTPLEYYEQGNWDWDAHVELGLACTDQDANIYFRNDFFSWGNWMPMAWTYGGEFFDEGVTQCLVNSEPFVTAIQYSLDMLEEHGITPPPGASSELGLSYRAGNLAIRTCWPRQPMNRAVALGGVEIVQPCYVAAGPEGAKCITKSNNFCVCSQTEAVQECYELVKVLCGPIGEKLEQEQFKFIYPGTKENLNDPEFWAMSAWDQSIQRISNEEHGHRLPITAKIPWRQMSSIWSQYTDEVWIGDATPEQCCENIAADINKLLEEAG
jgi:ABC-type glycerol-3-phosphate transport system substrate-binding protein